MKRNLIAEVQVNYRLTDSKKIKIQTSGDAEQYFRSIWNDQMGYRESMYIALLNRANFIVGFNKLSEGGTCSTVVDIRMLMQLLLKTNTHGFILCHNHPSGNIKPSDEDLNITKRIKEAAKLFDIQLLDHLILIEGTAYYSMADEGMM